MMSDFPLAPEDARQIRTWTQENPQALAFLDRCEALMAQAPQD